MPSPSTLRVALLGASGYTGAELLRLLLPHPSVRVTTLTAEKNAGRPVADLWPHLRDAALPDLVRINEVDFGAVDLVFCALPHGTTHEVVAALPSTVRVIDLSADFRFRDSAVYQTWYGKPHRAVHLQSSAVYGLTEVARAALPGARLIANPGCYPTAVQLPLIPLVKAGLVQTDSLLVDAASGVTGAGRETKLASLYAEVAEDFRAYGVATHRHAPEMDQGLTEAAGQPITVSFTPHLAPMSRGILATIHVRLAPGATVEDLRTALNAAYHDEPFVRLLPSGQLPATRNVRGTNMCHMAVVADRLPGHALVFSAIDNLVKGASGQAVQNMNAALGWPETLGLNTLPWTP